MAQFRKVVTTFLMLVFFYDVRPSVQDNQTSDDFDCLSTFDDCLEDQDSLLEGEDSLDQIPLFSIAATPFVISNFEWEAAIKKVAEQKMAVRCENGVRNKDDENYKSNVREIKSFFGTITNTLVVNGHGESPAHISAKTPHTAHILRYVLSKNPALHGCKDNRGLTPYMYTKQKIKIEYLDRAKVKAAQGDQIIQVIAARVNNERVTFPRKKQRIKAKRMVTRSKSSISPYKKSLIKKHNKHD